MSHSAYKDLNILHVWLNNQKSFVKHKKQLTNIYDKLDVKSEKTLGLLNEEPKLSEHVIENSRNFHKKEKNNQISKENKGFYQKIYSIKKRPNSIIQFVEEYDNKSPIYKNRSNIFRSMKSSEIEESNEKLSKRIEDKISILSTKKLEDEYKLKQYYKTLNSKFHLPNLVNSGKVIYQNLDTSTFQRTFSKDRETKQTRKTVPTDEYDSIKYSRNSQDLVKMNSFSQQYLKKNRNNMVLMRSPNKINLLEIKPFPKISIDQTDEF